jgi:DNA-binding transcriptional LysR family regulator
LLLRRHNLNLVPILRELLRTRSVSRTAEAVGLSQSAVSAALARLRETFEDDLLVMVGRHLVLTEKGAALMEPTERAYLELEDLLRAPDFDPMAETRRFVVATADYVTFLVAPPLIRMMAEQAPRAAVQFVDVGDDIALQLTRGTVDVVAIPDDTAAAMGEGLLSRPLFRDEMVVIASRERGPSPGGLTLAAYQAGRHAMFQISARGQTHQDRALAEHGVSQQNRVYVQQFSALPAIVEATDCLAVCHRRLAERFAQTFAIAIHPPPFPLPPIEICAYWARSMRRDPAHAWFRGLLAEAAAPAG